MPEATVQESLSKLAISDKPGQRRPKPATRVADSWEDDAEDESPAASPPSHPRSPVQASKDYPLAPPPTPSSPRAARDSFSRPSIPGSRLDVTSPSRLAPGSSPSSSSPSEHKHDARPETSTAAATRMIAAGLGLKAPRRTDEQRKYDQAMRENERRRREQEQEAKRRADEAKEQAKRDIWDG